MRKILITTDSTCDLSKEIIEQYNIKIIPLHVNFTDKSYKDIEEISIKELYEQVEVTKELPKTAAASPGEFIEFFAPYIEEGYDIFFTGISSKMSTTYQNAIIATEEFPEGRIRIVDSGNLSTGIGLLVLKACKFRDEGLDLETIASKVEALVPYVKSQFVIRTLDYLHKGGRCSSITMFFGSMLRIRPRIIVRNKEMKVGHKTIGFMKTAVAQMTNVFIKDLPNIDKDFVFVTDSLSADISYNEIDKTFKENDVYNKVKNVYHTNAGCVIGSHCGPGTIGILYIMQEEIKDEDLNV